MRIALFTLLTLVLVGCGISKEKYTALEDQLRKCEGTLADANTGKKTCEQDLTASNEKLSAANEKLAAIAQTKEELEKKTQTYEDLVGSLKDEIASGKVQISEMKDRLTVNLIDKILFDSGKVQVREEGKGALKKVADILKGVEGKRIEVEGHTDNVPVGPGLKFRFPTNWELSTSRATAVVRELADFGVPETRLSATGFADTRPVVSNDAEEGRRQNRRIEIVLVPELKAAVEPAKQEAAPIEVKPETQSQ